MDNSLSPQQLTEKGRAVQDVAYDIVVIGGGVAGICAAIAAARLGSRVALIQDRPVLGGNSSSEIRVWAIGAATLGYYRNARETGIVEEMLIETAFRSEGLLPVMPEPWPMWDLVLKEWCDNEPTLDLYLNTRAHAVTVSDSRIVAISALQVSTEKAFCFHAPYYIDSSGDGEIGYRAGAIWRLGQESRSEFDESIAPLTPNQAVLPSTIMFTARDAGRPVPFHPPASAYDFPTDDDLPFRHPRFFKAGYWWIEAGGDRDTINDNEEIRDELYRILFGVWNHIKNHGDHGADNLVLDWIGHVVGKRESRRFEGDYIMRQDDVLYGRHFPDAVAYGGWPLDLHPSEGFFAHDAPTTMADPEKPYAIPYRALYSRNIENLFLNGRLMSATHVAMGSIRVQKTLGIVGQAAGTAAHLCVQRKVTPRQLGQECIHEVQQLLLKHDCYIPHVRNQDPLDLARTATISASSHMPLPVAEPENVHMLYARRAQKFVISASRIDRVHVRLLSERDEAVELTAHLRAAPELWDFSTTEILSTVTAVLPPRHDGWFTLELQSTVDRSHPYWIEIEPVEGVGWYHSHDEPHGCQAAAWSAHRYARPKLDAPQEVYSSQTENTRVVDTGERVGEYDIEAHDGVWRFLRGTYVLRVEPQPFPYGPENVISGVSRPEQSADIWMADPAQPWPHWLELDFGQEMTFNTLQLTFDSNLDRPMDEGAKALGGTIPEIIKKYTVLTWYNEDWQMLFQEESNHQRWRRHRFKATRTQRLRILFESTHAASQVEVRPDPLFADRPGGGAFPPVTRVAHTARLFEVRVYHEQD